MFWLCRWMCLGTTSMLTSRGPLPCSGRCTTGTQLTVPQAGARVMGGCHGSPPASAVTTSVRGAPAACGRDSQVHLAVRPETPAVCPSSVLSMCSGEGVSPQEGSFSAGAHTDYGCLTFLMTDGTPGLQICLEGRWVAVPHLPGAFVINLGDMLERWTGGLYRSTLHRVVCTGGRERFSAAFFAQPNFETVVEVLPQVRCGLGERVGPRGARVAVCGMAGRGLRPRRVPAIDFPSNPFACAVLGEWWQEFPPHPVRGVPAEQVQGHSRGVQPGGEGRACQRGGCTLDPDAGV